MTWFLAIMGVAMVLSGRGAIALSGSGLIALAAAHAWGSRP